MMQRRIGISGPQFELVLRDKFGEISTVGPDDDSAIRGRACVKFQSTFFSSLWIRETIDRETFPFDL